LKVTASKSGRQSVTWADENGSVLETSKAYESPSSSIKQPEEGIDSSLRRASAEACAAALIEAAEAISSGTAEAEDAGEHVFIIFPRLLFFEAQLLFLIGIDASLSNVSFKGWNHHSA
jgi:hypothetical protein